MQQIRTLDRQRLGEQVAGHLRDLIIEGELVAGQALPPERELARQFGVSSTVIREALRTLSTSGLIEIRHGVGSFVTPPDHWRTAEPIAMLIRGVDATRPRESPPASHQRLLIPPALDRTSAAKGN